MIILNDSLSIFACSLHILPSSPCVTVGSSRLEESGQPWMPCRVCMTRLANSRTGSERRSWDHPSTMDWASLEKSSAPRAQMGSVIFQSQKIVAGAALGCG